MSEKPATIENPPAVRSTLFGVGRPNIHRGAAFRASRPPTLSASMIPENATITGKVTKIEVPAGSKFKTPMLSIETPNGMDFQIPLWASIALTFDPEFDRENPAKSAKAFKECIGHTVHITKMGIKHSKEFGVDFQVFDVILE